MKDLLLHNSMWELVLQSDFVTKMVLFVLLVMSISCWAIALYKLILFRIKKRQCKKVISSD